MFIYIQEGIEEALVYEFGSPRPSLGRTVRSHRSWAWRALALLVLLPSLVMCIMSIIRLSPPSDNSDAAMSALVGDFSLHVLPWMMLAATGIVLLGKSTDIRDTRRKVMRQRMRDVYVTDRDWSFHVMFPNGAAFDLEKPKLAQALNEFFADPSVVKADQTIKQSMTKTKKAVKEYKAKLKLVHLAQATYLSHHLADQAVLAEFARQRALLDQQMHPQLQEALDALDAERHALQKLVADTQPSKALH